MDIFLQYLLHFINSCVSLQAGLVLPGFIRKTMAYGCFVELPNNLSGLAPTKYLSDEFMSEASGLYQEAQSVMAKVREGGRERRMCGWRGKKGWVDQGKGRKGEG